LLVAGTALGTPVAGAIDWGSVPASEVVLLYPGQSSWEWNLTESSHSGGPKIRQGKPCYSCHKDEEEKIGSIIVSGEKLEPKPVNRPPTIPLTVQAANDGSRLFLRLKWPEPSPAAGKKTLVSVMLDDGSMKSFSVGGCWSACHDDVRGMPSAAPDSEMTKYLASSRTKVGRTGGGENYKSPTELQQRIAAGKFLEYWQAQLEPGKTPVAVDGIILKDRAKHASPSVQATASRDGDDWIVTLSRALKAPSKEAKDIVTGKTYTIGIAVHPAGTEHRFHHVSLERTLVLNEGKANLVAVKR
jgi:cytochrome c-type protein NapC